MLSAKRPKDLGLAEKPPPRDKGTAGVAETTSRLRPCRGQTTRPARTFRRLARADDEPSASVNLPHRGFEDF